MNDPTNNDTHVVRNNLSYFWSAVAALFLFIVLFRYGHILAILTLLIGYVSGTITQPIFGTFFSYNPSRSTSAPGGPAIGQADNVTVNNPPADAAGQALT